MIKPNKTADSAYIVAEDLGTAKNKYDIFFHRVSSKHRKADWLWLTEVSALWFEKITAFTI